MPKSKDKRILSDELMERLFAVVRSVWERRNLTNLLQLYGTADGSVRCLGQPQQAYLPHLL